MLDILVVFPPLLGAVLAGTLALVSNREDKARQENLDKAAQWITCSLLLASAAAAIAVFLDVGLGGNARSTELATWIDSGALAVSWALKVDTLTAVMMIVVTGVSSMVHVYSVGYMHHDKSIPRFMCYLSFFTFCMLMLITADNLVQLFFGWEGVGVASYLLIGFWYEKPSANAAAIKAFIVNRVGDFGFMLGIFAVFALFQSVSFDTIFNAAESQKDAVLYVFGGEFHALTVCCLLLFVGAMGKSAQLGLHTWLPDAMEGPTPVSALIHAATMVTAGVFMVARLSPLFEYSDTALAVVCFIGALTAFFAATVGCVQNDIKRVIAYSTCSQLGYMFFACGVSAYSAGIFHLMTHGFFKALLFLGAGSVIHAMSDEQDMRRMGGIWKSIPVTYAMMWIGSLALAGFGIPHIGGFAGFYSKDIILESAFAAHTGVGVFAFWLGIGAAFMTAFYSWRLIFMTFHGAPRADEKTMAHVHESPKIMTVPLVPLALGALFAGYLGHENFVGHHAEEFWNGAILILDNHPALRHAHDVPDWVKWSPLVVTLAGIGLAHAFYIVATDIPGRIASALPGAYRFLLNKWYWDEFYDWLLVGPAFRIGRGLWKGGDGALIDGVGPNGVAAATVDIARRAAKLQSGYVYHYAFAMLLGVCALITWYIVAG